MNMATNPPDLDGSPLELLIKLMRMTQAEDNIALVAIKKANSHLAKLGTDWEAVLRGKVRVIADPFANINIPQEAMNPNRNQAFRPSAPAKPSAPPAASVHNWPPPPPRPTPDAGGTYASRGAYGGKPKPQPSPVKPKPGAPAFQGDALEKTIVNKFEGICTKCKNRVPTGDGVAQMWKRPDASTYWTTEHSGTCPSTTRKSTPNTIDGFQV